MFSLLMFRILLLTHKYTQYPLATSPKNQSVNSALSSIFIAYIQRLVLSGAEVCVF